MNCKPSLQAVNAEYAQANARMGPYQEVIFKEEMITLDIPEEGTVVNNGWTITPRTYPGVGLVAILFSVAGQDKLAHTKFVIWVYRV